jgi:hypothetical protein
VRLIELQRDFRAWLTRESADAVQRMGGEPVAAGLAVYLNNYRSQLLACLGETYSVLHAWLGDTAFNAAAATHIDQVPPHSWTLDAYAHGFPDTLAALYPEDPEIAELALLERALAQAFVGVDAPVLALDTLGNVDWDTAVMQLVPTLVLLPARTNATALWSAITADTTPPSAALLEHPSTVAVWRRELTPMFRTLEGQEQEALTLIAAGSSFGKLCEVLSARNDGPAVAAMAGAWLGQWLRDGMIAAVSSPQEA